MVHISFRLLATRCCDIILLRGCTLFVTSHNAYDGQMECNTYARRAATTADGVCTHTHTHARTHTQVTRRVAVVVTYYFACWTPRYLLLFTSGWLHALIQSNTIVILSHVCFALVYVNSAVNPFLYAMLNRELRDQHLQATHTCNKHWAITNSSHSPSLSLL
jgi:hypothetical protein